MSRISWQKARITKWGTRKEKAHYQKLRAGYQEWRQQRKAEYAAYLETLWWKTRRKSKLERAGFKCEKCRTPDNLEVHHRSYNRLYREKDRDLQVLCRSCHQKIHDKKRVFTRSLRRH